MPSYLAIKLQGVMQSWGGHTYEDLRHSELIPTRSGLLGLLAACLGIDRQNKHHLERLSASVSMAIRIDPSGDHQYKLVRMMDFHTVMDARKVDGKVNKNPVVSRREYLCDAKYTVLIRSENCEDYSLEKLREAVQRPVYGPFLGRRSCPLSRPLYESSVEAIDFKEAFSLVQPMGGMIYSEQRLHEDDVVWRVRDEPIYARKRQFASRSVFIHTSQVEA